MRIGQDGLLTITLAANGRHPERKRVVFPAAIRRDTHKQAHTEVQRVIGKLQLWWY